MLGPPPSCHVTARALRYALGYGPQGSPPRHAEGFAAWYPPVLHGDIAALSDPELRLPAGEVDIFHLGRGG